MATNNYCDNERFKREAFCDERGIEHVMYIHSFFHPAWVNVMVALLLVTLGVVLYVQYCV